ncbi:MAG: type II secretion system F family protein [Nanoarchaeota archaeon]
MDIDKKKQFGFWTMFLAAFLFPKSQSVKPQTQKIPERKIEFFKKRFEKEQKKKIAAQEKKQRIRDYIERSGLNINKKKIFKTIFNIAVLINLAASAYLIYYFSAVYGITWGTIVTSMAVLWVLIFILLIFAMWIAFYIAVDLRVYKRKVDVEEVLPDFLQLTASNINAGMTIDRALWFAVRPKFGILAKEIEMVAKETMSGVDLKLALEKFAARYDSAILRRSINMLNEGIGAGGKIGDLINRIAINIQEQKSMMKEMSANVTTYVIFISFATIVAGPFLFAMSGVLIEVVHNLGSTLGGSSSAASAAGIPLVFSGTGITQSDFRIFAIVSLTITAFFSAVMVSIIKKGNVKSGVKYIPIFITVSLVLYFIVENVADKSLRVFF